MTPRIPVLRTCPLLPENPARDINLLLGIFFISGCLVVVVNLAVDLLYSLLDPRIELR